MDPRHLLTTGASGAGTTTLGRVPADRWSVPHADVDAVVPLTLDADVRMRRLHDREARRHGGQVPDEGAAGEAHRTFVAWAEGYDDPGHSGRSRAQHERWLVGLPCPVLRLDAAASVPAPVAAVAA